MPGPISDSAVTFRALMCTFFVCGQLGRNLFALPQKMRLLESAPSGKRFLSHGLGRGGGGWGLPARRSLPRASAGT